MPVPSQERADTDVEPSGHLIVAGVCSAAGFFITKNTVQLAEAGSVAADSYLKLLTIGSIGALCAAGYGWKEYWKAVDSGNPAMHVAPAEE